MCRKLVYLICTFVSLILALGVPARADVSIPVENYSFEIPDDGEKYDIDPLEPGVVTGWARTDPITSAGREPGWASTDGTMSAFMGKDAIIFNWTGDKVGTEFLAMEGDEFKLEFDARSTWQGCVLESQLYYYDAGDRVVFATMDVNLIDYPSMTAHTLTSNAIGIAGRDCRVGIQFKHRYVEGAWPDENIWCGFDYLRLSVTTPLMRAQQPDPEHESFYVGDDVTLTWVAGPDTTSVDDYQVYFSDVWADVNAGTPAADKGLTGGSTSKLITGIVAGRDYYWRIDTVIGATTYRGNIWNFNTKPVIAYNPDPCDGKDYVSVEPVLSWDSGSGAIEGHVVIFGDSFSEVNNAPVGTTGTAPPYRIYLTDVNDTNCTPAETGHPALDVSTTYYWRVDTVEVDPGTIHKGEVWSFLTVPYPGVGSILCELYTGITGNTVGDLTSASNYPDNPDVTEHLTSFEAPHRAFSDYGSRVHGWLYVDTTADYTFWIASGENSQLWLSTDDASANMSVIAYVDGEDGRDGWTNPREWDKYPEIQQSDPIHLEAGGLYYIMVLHKKAWGFDNLSVAWSTTADVNTAEIIPGTNLIPYVRTKSYGPRPNNNATDVEANPILSWTPGPYADKHDVYFGTDFDIVSDANRTNDPCGVLLSQNQDPNYYDPGVLENNSTYYWRIDDVNDSNIWTGTVWNFTTGKYFVVDNMDNYGDEIETRIYYVWRDGWDVNENIQGNYTGSQVYHWNTYGTGLMESTIVRSGVSMPFYYENDGYVDAKPAGGQNPDNPLYLYSETSASTSDLSIGSNWNEGNVKSLVLWFYGAPDNDASTTEQMYVKLNDSKVVYDGDMSDIKEPYWHEWNIKLAEFGIDLNNVTSISLGFGDDDENAGGAGIVYFDDIRLYAPRCVSSLRSPVADLDNDCDVDYDDLGVMVGKWLNTDSSSDPLVGWYKLDDGSGTTAADSSAYGNNGTLAGVPEWVSGYFNGGLDFNGVSDYVDCGNDVSLDITDAITLTAWVDTNDCNNGEHNPYVGKGDTSYAIKHNTSNSIQFFIYDEAAWYTVDNLIDDSFNDEWHHVAGTYDGMQLRLYIDGILSGITNHIGSMGSNTYNVNIGRNSEHTDRLYDGLIDDVRIYDKALSQAEILSIMDGTLGSVSNYHPITSPAELYDGEAQDSRKIDFKDLAILAADSWLEEPQLWP